MPVKYDRYKQKRQTSIVNYKLGKNAIRIEFDAGKVEKAMLYTYSRKSIPTKKFAELGRRLQRGTGANSFLLQHRLPYSKKTQRKRNAQN